MNIQHKNYHSADAMFDALADEIITRLVSAIEERGRTSFVVSGGSTPIPLYDRLSSGMTPESCAPSDLEDVKAVGLSMVRACLARSAPRKYRRGPD